MRPLAILAILASSSCTPAPATSPPPAQPSAGLEDPAPPTCRELGKVCHGHDDAGGLPRECHLMGHNPKSTEEQCKAKRAECVAACEKAAQGHGHSH